MPKGAYRLADGDVEHFSCAPGPAGWRYTADQIDLTVDADWSDVRLVVTAGPWQLRGGQAGPELLWRRGEDEHRQVAHGFTGTSPAYDVVVARSLGLPVGGSARVRLVEVLPPVLATRTVDLQWRRVSADGGDLPLEAYDVDDLATGERRRVHLVADVIVDRLTHLDTPPSGLPGLGLQP